MLKALHISDIHLSSENEFDQGQVLNALFDDIKTIIIEKNSRPDIIIISGDLANRANQENIYDIFTDVILCKIEDITGCSTDQIIVCPGNHDANQTIVKKNLSLEKRIREQCKDRDSKNKIYQSQEFSNYLEDKFEQYNYFQNILKKPNDISGIGWTLRQDHDRKINFVCINTALLTSTGLRDLPNDHRSLILPESLIVKSLEHIEDSYNTIIVSHHPINWLTEECEQIFQNVLRKRKVKNLNFFCGHMHNNQPMTSFSLIGNMNTFQAGALYQGRERKNCFSFVELVHEGKDFRLLARKFSEQRREFVPDTDISDDGTFYSSDQIKQVWNKYFTTINSAELNTWIKQNYRSDVQKLFDDGLSDKPMTTIFTPPPLFLRNKWVEGLDNLQNMKEQSINIDEIVKSSSHYIFHGDQEYGKTTLILYVSLLMCDLPQPRVPIYIKFNEIKNSHNSLYRLLKSKFNNTESPFSFDKVLKEGYISVLIDDVDTTKNDIINEIKIFLSRNNNIQVFITIIPNQFDVLSSSIGEDVTAALDIGLTLEHVFIKPMKRKQLREFVRKWIPGQINRHEDIINSITQEFRDMNLPCTAANSTILLSIFDEHIHFKAVNKSSLINRYIEYVLEKRSPLEIYRGSFDFDNKILILSIISERMVTTNTYKWSFQDIERLISDILNELGLSFSANEILKNLIKAKILGISHEGDVSFRYRAFMEYFVGERMNREINFRHYIFERERILSFKNEIQFYAGLNRSDSNLLDLISTVFLDAESKLDKQSEWSPDIASIDNFILPGRDDENDLFFELERQINSPSFSKEERDHILDAETPKNSGLKQEVYRPIFTNIGQEWIVSLLIYSSILRDLEHINGDLKSKHMNIVLHHWGKFIARTLLIIPDLAKHRQIKIDGVTYVVNYPSKLSDSAIARLIYVEAPNVIGRQMLQHLGSPKLQPQIMNVLSNRERQYRIISYLAQLLAIDLRIPRWTEITTDFAKYLSKSRYLSEALMSKLARVHKLGDLSVKDQTTMRGIIGKHLADLRGYSGRTGVKYASKVVKSMEITAHLERIKIISDNRNDEQ